MVVFTTLSQSPRSTTVISTVGRVELLAGAALLSVAAARVRTKALSILNVVGRWVWFPVTDGV